MKRSLIIALLCITTLFSLSAFGQKEDISASFKPPLDVKDTFVIGTIETQDPLFLDPFEATDALSQLALNGLFEGLFSFDSHTGEPTLAIAQEVVISDDELTWMIYIDPRARFSNGDTITAQMFIDSWIYLIDNAEYGHGNTHLVSLLDCIEGVIEYRTEYGSRSNIGLKAIAPHILEMRLITKAPYLSALLATLPFSAIHPSTRGGSKKTTITSGPFTLVQQSRQRIVLKKNPWYRNFDEVASDYIEIAFMKSDELAKAYSRGEVHWSLSFLPLETLSSLSDLHLGPEYSTGFYYFSADSGPYAKKEVRQALSLLIPWDELRLHSGYIFPTDRFIPDHTNLFTPKYEDQQKRTEQAFELLSEAGYPNGEGLPPLYMGIHKGAQVQEVSNAIADIWKKELGITVVLDTVSLSTYSRYPSLSPYDFAFITWIGDINSPFAFLNLFRSSSGYNLGRLESDEFDELVFDALKEPTQANIIAAENYLLDSGIVIPMFHGMTTNVINSSLVMGWYDNELNIHPVHTLQVK